MEILSEQGKIRISNEVVLSIAKKAIEEVDGVASFSGKLPNGIKEFFNKDIYNKKGVKVEKEEAEVTINISVIIKYGFSIPEVIKSVQENVKKSIETMTDIEVKKVNIFVQNIQL